MNGKVYLIGAGPGDPGLLTLKGKECITRADVVVYDFLAAPTLLSHAAENAECIYVGKKGGDHTLSQEGINALLVEKAQKGLTVARLKGGDPFIFGRGGEEAEVLIEAGIPFEVVPGVTSAIAAPAYAGIPLTHRKYTATVAFVTGHEDPNKSTSNIDWAALAKGIGTVVFLMGVKNLANIVEQLTLHGRSPDTPVGLVRWGTTTKQRSLTGTLANIVERVKTAKLKSPAIIVVGDVVRLRDTMQWFENRPLYGKRIVVTRARSQASDLVRRLEDLGAQCLEYPTIRIAPIPDDSGLDAAIENLTEYDWLIFTSVNGVRFFFERLFQSGKDVRALGHLKTAAIGPATSRKLLDFGIRTDILPETYRAESVIEAFSSVDIKERRVLLPRAKDARVILPAELKKMGARVDEIIVYSAEPVREHAASLIDMLKEKTVDIVTFTSSSTVSNFKSLLPDADFENLMSGVHVASIGPITSETAEKLGFKVDLTATDYTIPGLVEAIVQYQAAS